MSLCDLWCNIFGCRSYNYLKDKSKCYKYIRPEYLFQYSFILYALQGNLHAFRYVSLSSDIEINITLEVININF